MNKLKLDMHTYWIDESGVASKNYLFYLGKEVYVLLYINDNC